MLHSQTIWCLSSSRHCIDNEIIFEAPNNIELCDTVNNVANEISRSFNATSLEVSIYAKDVLGKALAYENLYLNGSPLLSVFRAGFIGDKTGPNPEYTEYSVDMIKPLIYGYTERIQRYWYNDGDKTYEFSPKNLGILTYMDFLYFNAVLQNIDVTKNISVLLDQFKYFTDATHIRNSGILTAAKSICFMKFIYSSSYATMVDELLHNAKLFTDVHNLCFKKEAYHYY